MRALLVTLFSASVVLGAYAADKEKPGTLPPPPPPVDHGVPPVAPTPPARTDSNGAIPEPEIVITTKGEDRYEEYRLGGRLYMIKVTPKIGKPYYLIDNTGSGEFVRSEFAPKISPPMWIIKRF